MSANSFVLKRGSNGWLVAATMVVVGLVVGLLVIRPMAGTLPVAVAAKVEDSVLRAGDAAAARYAAMDAFYGATTGDNLQRSRNASAARYAAMGAFYTAWEAANIRRGMDASAARYAAMVSTMPLQKNRGQTCTAARLCPIMEIRASAIIEKRATCALPSA